MKIKKISLIIIISIYCIGINQAQFNIGFKAGITHAWQDYGNNQERTGINGYHAYVLNTYQLNLYLQINVDLGLIQRGGQDNIPLSPILSIGGFQYYLDYMDMPVSIQANLPLVKNKLYLFGKAGYGLSYMIRGQAILLDLAFEGNEKQILNDDVINRFDHGINAGLGINYSWSNHLLIMSADYYRGLHNALISQSSKNRNINITLGYQYSLL